MDNKNNNQQYDKKMLKEYLNKFNKEQLKEHDPEGFAMMESIWVKK